MARVRIRRDMASQGGVAGTALDIFKEFLRLVATELRLLRVELGEKVGFIGIGIGLAVCGTLLLIAAVVLLFVAAIGALIEHGFSLSLATLIVFAAVLITGSGCLWFGIRQLRVDNLMPNKTIAQVTMGQINRKAVKRHASGVRRHVGELDADEWQPESKLITQKENPLGRPKPRKAMGAFLRGWPIKLHPVT